MYTVNKGPSRLVAKTRGGLTAQNIEITRKCSEPAAYDLSEMNGGPRPVFHARKSAHHNNNNNNHHNHHPHHSYNNNHSHSNHQQQWHPNGRDNWTVGGVNGSGGNEEEVHSPQHEELVNFIRDSWNVLAMPSSSSASFDSNLDSSSVTGVESSGSNGSSPINGTTTRTRQIVYYEEPPSPLLKDFGAFDLESWWGRRLFNNITKSVS